MDVQSTVYSPIDPQTEICEKHYPTVVDADSACTKALFI